MPRHSEELAGARHDPGRGKPLRQRQRVALDAREADNRFAGEPLPPQPCARIAHQRAATGSAFAHRRQPRFGFAQDDEPGALARREDAGISPLLQRLQPRHQPRLGDDPADARRGAAVALAERPRDGDAGRPRHRRQVGRQRAEDFVDHQ